MHGRLVLRRRAATTCGSPRGRHLSCAAVSDDHDLVEASSCVGVPDTAPPADAASPKSIGRVRRRAAHGTGGGREPAAAVGAGALGMRARRRARRPLRRGRRSRRHCARPPLVPTTTAAPSGGSRPEARSLRPRDVDGRPPRAPLHRAIDAASRPAVAARRPDRHRFRRRPPRAGDAERPSWGEASIASPTKADRRCRSRLARRPRPTSPRRCRPRRPRHTAPSRARSCFAIERCWPRFPCRRPRATCARFCGRALLPGTRRLRMCGPHSWRRARRRRSGRRARTPRAVVHSTCDRPSRDSHHGALSRPTRRGCAARCDRKARARRRVSVSARERDRCAPPAARGRSVWRP